MKIEEFIDEYKKATDKDRFIKKHILSDKYTPYIEKIARCENIIKTTMYTDVDGKSVFKQNSAMQLLYFTLTIIDLYTDIDVEYDGVKHVEIFDKLDELGLIDLIFEHISSHEFETWNTLLNMSVDDLIVNTRDIVGYIESKIGNLGTDIDSMINEISKLEKTDINIEG